MEEKMLPKKERPYGLFLYCNGCHKLHSYDSLVKCKCNKLVYKARVHVPGTKKGVKLSVLKSDNFTDAFVEFRRLKMELEKNSYQKIQIKKVENIPVLLIDCFAYYMGYLNNVGVPKYKRKERTVKYVNKFEADFKRYMDALELAGYDCKILKFTDVTEEMVGEIHEYLLKVLGYANKTYNNAMANFSGFTSHIIKKFHKNYTNPFLEVEKLYVESKNLSVQQNEFEKLMNLITSENGVRIKKRANRNDTKENVFRDWLKNGIYLGLFTGGRSEEVVELKWSQIQINEDGSFDRFKVIHYKMNKSKSHLVSEKDKISKDFVITEELGNFLIYLGYESYKGTDNYLFAPERGNRKQVGVELSAGFNHYYRLLETGKVITFKNLRKTYITSAVNLFGMGALALSSHTNMNTVKKHYYDGESVKDEARKTFSVFKKPK